jgi:chromosome segregation ATPase
MDQQNRSLRSKISLLEDELQQKSQRLLKIQTEAQATQTQYQDLLARVVELQNANEALSTSNAKLEDQWHRKLAEQEKSATSLMEKDAQIASQTVAISEMALKNRESEARMHEAIEGLQAREKVVDQQTEIIERLKERVRKAKRKYDSARQRWETEKNDLAASQKKSETLASENSELEREVSRLRFENSQFRSENLQLQSDVAQLRKANEEFAEQNDRLKSDTVSLQFECSRVARIAGELRSENTRMHSQIGQCNSELSEMTTENAALKCEISDLKRKSTELEMINAKWTNSVVDQNQDTSGSDLRRELATVKLENESLAKKLLRLRAHNTELKNQNTQFSTQVATLSSENARLKGDASALAFDKDKFKSEKTRLKKELAESKSENSQLLTDLENAREALKGQRREIDRLKQFESIFHQSAEILEESSIPPSKFPEALRNRLRVRQELALTSAPSVSEASVERPASARRPELLEEVSRPAPPPRVRRVQAPTAVLQPDVSLDRIIQMHNRLWKQESEQISLFAQKRG